ncbi:hypothetical protein DFP72DRAFT_1075044 [Ephemerocybe angulata]|uniref:Uncharacterized protein n=1 Tax=Ephemerocybe angulata TaxID=980116 RepID=A0A8H6LZH9_9AGAR|nr:hypothetical protein DFP72DRAFT_1075044 [Tulosesus angulatus]
MSADPQEYLQECLEELCRKPSFEDLIELAKDWARDLWYTDDCEAFYLRDMLTHLPRFDIPPSGPDEVSDLVKRRFSNLLQRSTKWDEFIAPKISAIRGSGISGEKTIQNLLWLREKSPAGYEPKVPLPEDDIEGETKFVWSWELQDGFVRDSSGAMIDMFLDKCGIWVTV